MSEVIRNYLALLTWLEINSCILACICATASRESNVGGLFINIIWTRSAVQRLVKVLVPLNYIIVTVTVACTII